MSGAPRRVRLRLAAWSTVVFAAVLVAVGVAVVAAFARALDAQAMRQADASAQRVERLLVDELGGDVDAAELAEELREEADVAWYAVQVPGWPRIESAEWQRADVAALRAEMDAVVASRATRRNTVDVEHVGPLRVVANSVAVGGADIAFAIGFEERPLRDSMTSFLAILAIVGPLALIVAFAGGYWLAGRLLAPVRVLADAAEDITIERIRTRLPVRGESDEFDRVAVA
ncbi:MAG: HAMP domain-containing protein, partial [Planctomycetes bacterium]|nr:HAMP domain-containing protein [Planctomycetota bacterium]